MSIIINTGGGGAGSTPDLQQVLIAGSGFSQSNSINCNGFNFTISGSASENLLISGFTSIDIYNFNINIGNLSAGGWLNFNNGVWQIYDGLGVDNYLVINPFSDTYKFGAYATPNMGSIRISQSDINYVGDEARFAEVNASAGTWAFDGADGGFWTASPPLTIPSDDHLIVYINGAPRYIELREPQP